MAAGTGETTGMNFFAVNGSPRGPRGVTDLVLREFVAGMTEAGGEPAGGVPIRYLRDMDVRPCRGDWACWTRTPGVCSQDDDMNALYPLIRAADVLVLATPVYVDGMTGPMKTFVDRLVAILDPMIEVRQGRSRHPLIAGQELDKAQIVLVSVCGFHELENFEPLVAGVEAASKNLGRRYGGALLRPHGPAFGAVLRQAATGNAVPPEARAAAHEALAVARDVLAAARESGRDLVRWGRMDEAVLERVRQPLMDRDSHIAWTNASWRRADEARTLRLGAVPRCSRPK